MTEAVLWTVAAVAIGLGVGVLFAAAADFIQAMLQRRRPVRGADGRWRAVRPRSGWGPKR